MTDCSIEPTKTLANSETSPTDDVEKQEQQQQPGAKKDSATDDSFLGEKIKERAPPGLNGSLVFLYAIFFAEFTIGWVNLNKCSINRLIPIYLIIAGFLGAVTKHISKYRHNVYCFWAMTVLIVVVVAWHILGTYVVYKEYQPNYEPQNGPYCNRTTYLVAFWTLTIEYTLLVLFILLSCCYMLMRNSFNHHI
ncbi:transmembrane protein 272-like [Rhynchophorus ferrugineus]|uniref:Uncharacterized protein n=1 Tax=Rhynchophorus ferrugineus TaxID=354439 RepID=A0A834IZD8_RHYFE|nr:hypothetical protein GWI33_003453 [Rhynchophorus ferrugineus]